MTITSLLTSDLVKISLNAKNKFQAIEELIDLLDAKEMLRDRNLALDDVIEREQYLSTGLEHGLAVPHGKSKSVTHLVMAMGVIKEGIDFDSLDGNPTTIIFLLVSPKNTSGPHIKALAKITRQVRDAEVREKILAAKSSDEIIDLFKTLEADE